MIAFGVPDLVLIASRVLGLPTVATLDLLDPDTAELAVSEAAGSGDPANHAAALLHALVHHRPFRLGNDRIALLSALQVLALNGVPVDLEPPEETAALIAAIRAGTVERGEVLAWLVPRLRSRSLAKETAMRRWFRRRPRCEPMQRADWAEFEQFTDRARRIVTLASQEAGYLRHNHIGTEHLLLGLLREDAGIAAKALAAEGVSLTAVRHAIVDIIGSGHDAPAGPLTVTPRARQVLFTSSRQEAKQLRHNYIGTEHLLLGLLREGQCLAAQILTQMRPGISPTTLRAQIMTLLTGYEYGTA